MAKKKGLIEIRWHGRGGQGAVTASELLAEAALEEGMYFQAFPDYGPERMGAPIRAYTRLSYNPIYPHCQVTNPDVVMVLDPTLIGTVDFTQGLKKGGILIINTPLSPDEIRQKINLKNGKVFTVDASKISMETVGRNMPNTPMIGALVRATGALEKEGLIHATRARLTARINAKIADANIKALERAFKEAKEG